MSRDAASQRQVDAANPRASTWLSANAGSGKTRVLTDRVARLLLNGVEPQRILCLTYTKAAASEMQNRLFHRLGEWAMLGDGPLGEALLKLGIPAAEIGAERLRGARRLFARAIETPGGLKIQTIHSFCASLLRRFPLEAGVTPQFSEIDDRAAELLREEVIETLADDPRHVAAVDGVAALWTGDSLRDLVAQICQHRAAFADPLDRRAAFTLFGLPEAFTAADVLADVCLGNEGDLCRELIAALETGGATDLSAATKLRAARFDPMGLGTLAVLEGVFLTGAAAKEPFTAKIGSFPTKATRARVPRMAMVEDLMKRVEAARARRLALVAAERAAALHRFAAAFLPEYDRRKGERGWLDFDDLITRARALLTDRAAAQWVLFRLDGGIDHILVDEAQDTSPGQWAVIERLAEEFAAGEGARVETPRTLFVVGDKKQSIYSFQGADLAVFEAMRQEFGQRLARIEMPLVELTLAHSFRSSAAVLGVVDATFAADGGKGLGGDVRHIAFKNDMPGRVDLWPLVPKAGDPEEDVWYEPVDLVTDQHHEARLARMIAREIRRLIDAGTLIPEGNGRTHPMTEGDVLILVRRRNTLFREIIRACKQAGLAIAGADRLKLAAEMAIRDLTALLSFLVTPEDDLSLAAALRSPLFGWGEGDLYRLAEPRGGAFLWEALRRERERHGPTLAMLDDLRDQSDFLRPYELAERILTRHGGRGRLLARLGPEAEDGINAFLAQALAYEQAEVPSLQGFVGWLASGDVEVKRQVDAAGGRIRVMTVHGSKGLEAPVVIMPDTAKTRPQEREQIYLSNGTPLWRTAAAESPDLIASARGDLLARQEEERARLLYVAMTRAQSWLIVCGAGEPAKDLSSWHDRIAVGMARAAGASLGASLGASPGSSLGADHGRGLDEGLKLAPCPFPPGEGKRLSWGDWPADRPADRPGEGVAASAEPAPAALPGWTMQPAPPPREEPGPVSPSALGGAKALPGESGLDEAAAKLRGTRLHLLLEHLPHYPAAEWDRLSHDLLALDDNPPPAAERLALLAEARAVIGNPALGFLFAPETLAEVPVTAEIGGRRMLGTIDRLVITSDHVLAIDFKSNAVVPSSEAGVPEGILRQMGAYAAALRLIWPGRRVETAVLWTRTGVLMPLCPARVAAALAAAIPATREADPCPP
ncbi:double-strand break repair helicase AddA [Haematobacter genomosp. 1]|uniref:DNA 3'-5' helicase n=1 Tax=Haematobacter genomosp. 1 TaxID=366618 RepID=A0A212A8M1_9RHOB|nr:double-strand break repair helicase AddA [Haematobacter genomosp. 1]OWJ76143.1 double-strand break repair helicase AddA [Haematobacter genomosp. 1]